MVSRGGAYCDPVGQHTPLLSRSRFCLFSLRSEKTVDPTPWSKPDSTGFHFSEVGELRRGKGNGGRFRRPEGPQAGSRVSRLPVSLSLSPAGLNVATEGRGLGSLGIVGVSGALHWSALGVQAGHGRATRGTQLGKALVHLLKRGSVWFGVESWEFMHVEKS